MSPSAGIKFGTDPCNAKLQKHFINLQHAVAVAHIARVYMQV